MPDCLRAALEYAGLGWRVHPLIEGKKTPRLKAWQEQATTDEETIGEWFTQWPDANLGVVMGESSGIVDIECDSVEAERSFTELFGAVSVVTPTFQSVRGKHRLFRWTGELPNADKAQWKIKTLGEIDFKTGGGGKGSYCLFPPSRHPDGPNYEWLIPPSEAEPMEIPRHVIDKLVNLTVGDNGPATKDARPQEYWDEIAQGVAEPGRNEAAAQYIGKLLNEIKDPYNQGAVSRLYEFIHGWNKKNRPPMDELELRRTFESILKRHRQQWTAQQNQDTFEKYAERSGPKGETSTAEWKIIRVKADPVIWKLFSPLWESKARGGFIQLSTEQLTSAAAIRVAAAEQAGVGIRKDFNVAWDGTKSSPSLYQQLMEVHTEEEAAAEDRRDCILAGLVWDQLTKPGGARDKDEPDPRGIPTTIEAGGKREIWFKCNYVMSNVHMATTEKFTMRDLSALLRFLGASTLQKKLDGAMHRFKVLDDKGLDALQEMAFIDVSEARKRGSA